MTVDIIIPCYYNSNIIRPCLQSIVNQTVVDKLTVIMVNDCSPYTNCEYQDLRNEFSTKIPIKYFKTEINSGPGVARQLGLNHASADWVMFVDDDDELANETAVESLLNLANLETVVSVTGQSGRKDVNTNTIVDISKPWIHHHGSIYNRKILMEKQVQYDPRMSYLDEDCCFSHMLFLYTKDYKQLKLNKLIYIKKINQNQISLAAQPHSHKELVNRIGLNTNILQYAFNANDDNLLYYYTEAVIVVSNLLYFFFSIKQIDLTRTELNTLLSFIKQYDSLYQSIQIELLPKDCESIINFYNQVYSTYNYNLEFIYDNIKKYNQDHLNWISIISNKVEQNYDR